ncbi:glycosyltransferase family A protein [Niallia taxi]|uniref:glycosyltransferase family 2 protein n=1 Tax=Niallia taxi TaxID=2499688 RepID=UPI003981D0E3
MINPLISIIIPVYNVEAYITRCLDSLKNQTYKHIEIVVINDGSTDNSLSIVEEIGKTENRIRIYNKENGGQASARNLGISIARGEYFMFVDSDDYLDNNAVQACVEIVNSQQCDLIVFDYYKVNKQGQKQHIHLGTELHTCSAGPCNKLFSRKLWENYRFPEGYWYEDLGIVPVVVANASNIAKIDQALYFYDVSRETSQTNTINPLKLNDKIYMVENVYKELEKQGKLNKNLNKVEYLFIDHLLNGLLFKLMYVEDTTVRMNIAVNIKTTMDRYFPKWEASVKHNNKGIKKLMKRIVIHQYLKGQFLLGDVLLKYPKQLKKKIV